MKSKYLLIVVVSILLIGSSCSRKKEVFGKVEPSSSRAKVGDILRNPSEFENKLVKVQGEIADECPTGHWCYIKDESGTIYVEFMGFTIPQMVRKNVAVYGKVMIMDDKPMIHAQGMEEQ